MTYVEKIAEQSRIHHILLQNKELDVIHNYINNTLDYKGVDITEPLITIYEYFMESFRVFWGLPIPEKKVTEKKDKYNFVRDKKPKVYISGKITGLEEKVYKNNFNSAELYLTGLGYDVVNPVSYTGESDWSWSDFMKMDLKLLLDCDYIYILDGWEDSTGAKVEYSLARDIGIKELRLDDNGVML